MRREFSARTKLEAWERCKGHCESCGKKIVGEVPNYDHRIPCAMGGTNSVHNCDVLCRACHALKTAGTDVPSIAKSRRLRKSAAGVDRPKKRKIPGSKGTGLRKRMDGTVIRVIE